MKAMVFSLAMVGAGGALLSAAEPATAPAKDAAMDKCCMKMGMMEKAKEGGMMCGMAEHKSPAGESKEAAAPTQPASEDHSAHHH